MDKLPFSVYDFFGYLGCGFLLCMSADAIAGQNWYDQDPSVVWGAFWVIVAYVAGHINANLASWALERWLLGRLGRPNVLLFGRSGEHWRLWERLFPGYYTPLDDRVRERVLDRAATAGIKEPGEALFHHARTFAKGHAETWAKMETFLQLYGFCRNMSFCLGLITVALACSAAWTPVHAAYAVAATMGAVGMLYRYLKFFRQYSYEMFTAYPDVADHRPAN